MSIRWHNCDETKTDFFVKDMKLQLRTSYFYLVLGGLQYAICRSISKMLETSSENFNPPSTNLLAPNCVKRRVKLTSLVAHIFKWDLIRSMPPFKDIFAQYNKWLKREIVSDSQTISWCFLDAKNRVFWLSENLSGCLVERSWDRVTIIMIRQQSESTCILTNKFCICSKHSGWLNQLMFSGC